MYLGQESDDEPRLKEFDAATLKIDALQHTIPGRQKQIEFIRKYQPKAVTITIGGNDIGFGRIINACINPVDHWGGEWTNTCSYAKESEKRKHIGDSIRNLKEKLTNLFVELKQAGGPDMKLYVLGYPELIRHDVAETNMRAANIKACGMNVRLNYDERVMAQEAVRYLNRVIRLAAYDADAMYIDIENAFNGYRLCDKYPQRAVNGITGLPEYKAESFHPNTFGHEKITARIWQATNGISLHDYECTGGSVSGLWCPNTVRPTDTIPQYFKQAMAARSKHIYAESLMDESVKTYAQIVLPKGVLNAYKAYSEVTAFVYSAPTQLGSATIMPDGSTDLTITIPPNIQPGYHTFELQGIDEDGEPLVQWKIIEVRSHDDNDYDGDGIPNDKDHCTYIQPMGVDTDNDGIDDGCDPEIEIPQRGTDTPAINTPPTPTTAKQTTPLHPRTYTFAAEQAAQTTLQTPDRLVNRWPSPQSHRLIPETDKTYYHLWLTLCTAGILLALTLTYLIIRRKHQ